MPPKRKANAIAEDASKQTVYVLKTHYHDDNYKAVVSSSEVVAVYANETSAQIAAILPNLERHFINECPRTQSSLREGLKAVSPTLEKYFAQSSDGDEQCIPTKIKDYAKVIKKMPVAEIATIYYEVEKYTWTYNEENEEYLGGTTYDVTAYKIVY